MVLPNGAGMKRTRVDCAAAAVSSEEFRKGGMEIIRDKGGDDILFAIRDDKEVTGPDGVEVVLPSRTWIHSGLGTVRAWGPSFYISVHCFSL